MNRLPGEQDGGQTNGWGIVFHKHNFKFQYKMKHLGVSKKKIIFYVRMGIKILP